MTTWVSWHQDQEMMRWQWHQLDHLATDRWPRQHLITQCHLLIMKMIIVYTFLSALCQIPQYGYIDEWSDDVTVSVGWCVWQISTIGRYEYKKSCTLLVQLFDESVQTFQSLVSSGQTSIETAVQEGASSCTDLQMITVVPRQTKSILSQACCWQHREIGSHCWLLAASAWRVDLLVWRQTVVWYEAT